MYVGPWTQHPDTGQWHRWLPSGAVAVFINRAGEEWMLVVLGDFPFSVGGTSGPTFSRHATLEDAKRAGDEWLADRDARRAAEKAARAKLEGPPPFLWTAENAAAARDIASCSQCGADTTVVVVGAAYDYETMTAFLCRACVEAALRLFPATEETP